MYSFKELQNIANETLKNLNFEKEPLALYTPVKYVLEVGGKRLRPVLTMMSANLYSDNPEIALKEATGLEIFHNFTLLHDDIMDKADLRRNMPTVHKKWNENTAILSGDAMMIVAYGFFIGSKNPRSNDIFSVFNDTALKVCEGQQYDMDFEKLNVVTEEQYLEMIRLKTAVLLAACLKIGALAAGAPIDECDKLYEAGINLGLAFQLQDDYLDVFGNTQTFGKNIGGGIASNKKTYLLIKALALADHDEKMELEKWLSFSGEDLNRKVVAVTEIYKKLGIRELAKKKILDFSEKSKNILNELTVEKNRKKELENLIGQLIDRSF